MNSFPPWLEQSDLTDVVWTEWRQRVDDTQGDDLLECNRFLVLPFSLSLLELLSVFWNLLESCH